MILPKFSDSFIFACNYALLLTQKRFEESEAEIISLSKSLQKARYINFDKSLSNNINIGWYISAQLIQTPLTNVIHWYYVENYFIKEYIADIKLFKGLVSFTFLGNKYCLELNKYSLGLHKLSYYYRLGYEINEVIGEGYLITEPIGKTYFVDLYNCNCINYLKDGFCLHIELAHIYHNNIINLKKVCLKTIVN
jgi:hypothetical protein